MTGKLLIGLGTFLVSRHFYNVLQLNASEKAILARTEACAFGLTLVDKVVKSTDSDTLYLVKKIAVKCATRIEYVSYQAYLNDGKKEIVTLSPDQIENMGLTSNAHMTLTGFEWDKE